MLSLYTFIILVNMIVLSYNTLTQYIYTRLTLWGTTNHIIPIARWRVINRYNITYKSRQTTCNNYKLLFFFFQCFLADEWNHKYLVTRIRLDAVFRLDNLRLGFVKFPRFAVRQSRRGSAARMFPGWCPFDKILF